MSAISAEKQKVSEVMSEHQSVEELASKTSSITNGEKRNFGHIMSDLGGLALGLSYFLTDLGEDMRGLSDSKLDDILRWLDEVSDVCADIPADYIGSIWRSTSCKDVKTVTLPARGRRPRAGSAPELLAEEDCESHTFLKRKPSVL